jgi:hypothetical protein
MKWRSADLQNVSSASSWSFVRLKQAGKLLSMFGGALIRFEAAYFPP